MIANFVILAVFVTALLVTLFRGVGATFAYVLLPVLMLIFNVPALEIQKLPDIDPFTAVGYGTVVGLAIKGGEAPGFRWHVMDWLVLAMLAIAFVSALTTGVVWTGVSTLGAEFFGWVFPYFMGRAAMARPAYRMRAAQVLSALACVAAFLALIEFRLWPMVVSRTLQSFGLSAVGWDLVLSRWGFFRAQSTFAHPIDLGISGALVGCLILSLAATGGERPSRWWVVTGVSAAAIMTVTSMSFTSFVAVFAIVGLAAALMFSRASAILIPVAAVAVLIGYVGLTLHFVSTPIPETSDGSALSGSWNIRHLIVVYSYPFAMSAGPFGHGETVSMSELDLLSLDNAYLLMIIRQGWLYFGGFLLMAGVTCAMATRAIYNTRSWAERLPLAAVSAAVIGTMMGMYTVWFGFAYAKLFLILLGILATMSQILVARRLGSVARPSGLQPRRRLPRHVRGIPGPSPAFTPTPSSYAGAHGRAGV